MINAPHGVCLAASTGIGLRYNLKVCEKEFAFLGAFMKKGNQAASAMEFISGMEGLVRELGFPVRPSELGIRKEEARTILEKTLAQERRIKTNPRPLDGELLAYIEEGI